MNKFLILFVFITALCLTANAESSYVNLVKDQPQQVKKGEVYTVDIAEYSQTLPVLNMEKSVHRATDKGVDVKFDFSIENGKLIIKISPEKDDVYEHFFITPSYMHRNEGFLGIYISLREGWKITGGMFPLKQKGRP